MNQEIAQVYKNLRSNSFIDDESLIVGTANVEDYFEVSNIEVFKLLAIGVSVAAYNGIGRYSTDTSKTLVDFSTGFSVGIGSDPLEEIREHSVGIFYTEVRNTPGSGGYHCPYFGVVLTPEDYTKFYVLNVSLSSPLA